MRSLLGVIARGGTVLDKLSQEAIQELLDTARFNERGLTTFKAARIEVELTPAEIRELLRLFRIDDGGVIKDAECVKRATCKVAQGHWCVIANC